MPISDDIKEHYPDDWESIREHVLERAAEREETEHGYSMPEPALPGGLLPCAGKPKCEWCGAPNGSDIWRRHGRWALANDDPDFIEWYDEETGSQCEGEVPLMHYDRDDATTVVLTIAHLDQDPRIADPDRLRALCQRCHLTYDNQPEQRAKRRRIYAELRGQMTLLEER